MPTLTLDHDQLLAIRAALWYWKEEGMTEPRSRTDECHEIAINNDDDVTTLGDDDIDELCDLIMAAHDADDVFEFPSKAAAIEHYKAKNRGMEASRVSALVRDKIDNKEIRIIDHGPVTK